MIEKEFSLQDEDNEKIKTAIRLHTPIEITSYTLPKNMEVYIHTVLSEFLSECQHDYMTEYLTFCVGELLNNAKKANTKRIYFKEKKLDINNEIDYNEGMVFFKDETLMNIDHYLEEQKKAGLFVKLILQISDDFITIEIRNNCALTKFESQRIQEKIKIAQQYDNIDDVFTKVLDQTEGAGLGIIIIILMLQKIGLSKDNYKVISENNETITKIELPLNQEIQEEIEEISEAFVDLQDAIPIEEESLEELKKKINSENTTEEQIVSLISKDATLVFLLLSEACKIQKDCDTISKAVHVLGKEKLNYIFTEENPKIRKISPPEEIKKFWNHAYKVAFFAYNIAKNFVPKTGITPEQIYVAALLHDIEPLLLAVATPIQKAKLEEICIKYEIPQNVIDLFYHEHHHSKSGGQIAKAWGLPSNIIEAIKFHNDLLRVPDSVKEMVFYVYLADILQYYIAGMVEFYQLNRNILSYFGIDSEIKLNYIIKQIKTISMPAI